jgi:serine protease Do
MRRTRKGALLFIAIVVVAVAWLAFGDLATKHAPPLTDRTPSSPAAVQTPTVIAPAASPRTPLLLPDFNAVYERARPVVVNITVEGSARSDPNSPQLDPDDPFFEFFKRFSPPRSRRPQPFRSLGSGFIISNDGLILTNAHVVGGAKAVTVRLADRREFKAQVLGIDRPTDVALLKIDAHGLPTAIIGNVDSIKPGQWAAAMGSPFGFENTITAGVISAKFRALPSEIYVPFIQSDVAVNPGNSGGPLLDDKGEVIGMNSQIYSSSGGYEGLSFAIPVDVALHVKDHLLKYGKVQRGRIGVTVQPLNWDLARSFGLSTPAGALISAVEADSPGDKAGLKPGDVIVKLDGHPITESGELPVRVAQKMPGTTATLEVWRNGEVKTVAVKLGAVRGA